MNREPHDIIVENGTVFDGRDRPGKKRHVGIRAGLVTDVSEAPLVPGPITQVVNADGSISVPPALQPYMGTDRIEARGA